MDDSALQEHGQGECGQPTEGLGTVPSGWYSVCSAVPP